MHQGRDLLLLCKAETDSVVDVEANTAAGFMDYTITLRNARTGNYLSAYGSKRSALFQHRTGRAIHMNFAQSWETCIMFSFSDTFRTDVVNSQEARLFRMMKQQEEECIGRKDKILLV